MRFLTYFLLFSLGFTAPGFARCQGENLFDSLSGENRAAIDAEVASLPFNRGNLWKAERAGATLHIQGTFHLDDPRHGAIVEGLRPIIDAADLVLVEGDNEDLAKVKAHMARHPELMFLTEGPTLPEMLPEELWQRFATEMNTRGIPTFLASKFRPGYATIILGLPPCAIDLAGGEPNGLDKRILAYAEKNGIATDGLEPFDTALSLFDLLEEGDPLDALRLGLAVAHDGTNMLYTLSEAYFAGEHRAIWELSRLTALATPGFDPAQLAQDFAKFEKVLLTDRNANWIPVITKASEAHDRILVAVGAAHLSGEHGLLNLLLQAGFTLSPVN